MTHVFSSEAPGSRWVLRQLSRFRQSLESLIARLRGELATTVGRTVGEAVREAFHQIGGGLGVDRPISPAYRPPPPRQSNWERSSRDRSEDAWGEHAGAWGDDSGEERWGMPEDDFEPPGRYDEAASRHAEPAADLDTPTPAGNRWSLAVKNGLRAGSWWLARMTKYPVAGAALTAIVAALGSYFADPALLTGVAGVCLGLFGLADGIAAAAAALNR